MLRGHPRGERQRPRGLETHRYPPAGRLKATGPGQRPVPVSTQLGEGAAHSSSSQCRALTCRASTGVQSTHRTPGPSRPDARPRSAPHESSRHRLGLGPIVGPVRPLALPCPSIAFSRSGARSSFLLYALRGPQWSAGGRAGAFVPAQARPPSRERVNIAAPLETRAHWPRARSVMTYAAGPAVGFGAYGPFTTSARGEERGRLEGLLAAQHVVHRPRELVG